MSLISFIKEAGEKLFHFGDSKSPAPPAPAPSAAAPAPAPTAGPSEAVRRAGESIETYVRTQNLPVENLKVEFDPNTAKVTVRGTVPDQATREKVVLCCGNVQHVAGVVDELTVTQPAPQSQWHTVAAGDNLSKIAKKFYGDANQYPKIFEANKPMLSDPDKIYPGQVLRIPPA